MDANSSTYFSMNQARDDHAEVPSPLEDWLYRISISSFLSIIRVSSMYLATISSLQEILLTGVSIIGEKASNLQNCTLDFDGIQKILISIRF